MSINSDAKSLNDRDSFPKKLPEAGSVLSQLIDKHVRPETRDIGAIGPVDGMNQLSALGPYFRIVLTTGDNQNRSEFLISKGAAEGLRDTLVALLKPPSIFTDEFFDSFEA